MRITRRSLKFLVFCLAIAGAILFFVSHSVANRAAQAMFQEAHDKVYHKETVLALSPSHPVQDGNSIPALFWIVRYCPVENFDGVLLEGHGRLLNDSPDPQVMGNWEA